MKQQIKERQTETSQFRGNTNNEPIWEDCIEYFLERCEFKFVYSNAQIPTAEELVNDTNNKGG